MKLMIAILMSLTAFLQACENAPVRREQFIAEHPEWNAEQVQLIKAGLLVKGMSQDQVKAAWGKPCWSCTGTTKGNWGEAWEYATQTVFFDKNGTLTRWESN
jgi:hypothetical protein